MHQRVRQGALEWCHCHVTPAQAEHSYSTVHNCPLQQSLHNNPVFLHNIPVSLHNGFSSLGAAVPEFS